MPNKMDSSTLDNIQSSAVLPGYGYWFKWLLTIAIKHFLLQYVPLPAPWWHSHWLLLTEFNAFQLGMDSSTLEDILLTLVLPEDGYWLKWLLTISIKHFLLQYVPLLHPVGIPMDFFLQSLRFPAGHRLQHPRAHSIVRFARRWLLVQMIIDNCY